MRKVACFTFKKISLMSGLREDSWVIFDSSFNLLQYTVLVKVYEEHPALHRYADGKWGSISIVFLDNSGYTYLMLHQNLTSGTNVSFWKINCNVEYENTSMSFLVVYYYKIQWSNTLNRSFIHSWFYYTIHW